MVCISSQVPNFESYAYSSSKAAVHHLTRHLAARLGKEYILCNAIAPGSFPSKMMAETLRKHGDEIVARVPVGRVGTPEDVAGKKEIGSNGGKDTHFHVICRYLHLSCFSCRQLYQWCNHCDRRWCHSEQFENVNIDPLEYKYLLPTFFWGTWMNMLFLSVFPMRRKRNDDGINKMHACCLSTFTKLIRHPRYQSSGLDDDLSKNTCHTRRTIIALTSKVANARLNIERLL